MSRPKSANAFRRLGAATTLDDLPWSVSFVRDGTAVAAACNDNRLRILPLDGGKIESISIGSRQGDATNSRTAVSPDGTRVLAGKFCIDVVAKKKVWAATDSFPRRRCSPIRRRSSCVMSSSRRRAASARARSKRLTPP